MLGDALDRRADRLGDAHACAFGVRCRLAVAPAEPDRTGQLGGEELHLLLRARGALTVVEGLRLLDLRAQILDPVAVGGLRLADPAAARRRRRPGRRARPQRRRRHHRPPRRPPRRPAPAHGSPRPGWRGASRCSALPFRRARAATGRRARTPRRRPHCAATRSQARLRAGAASATGASAPSSAVSASIRVCSRSSPRSSASGRAVSSSSSARSRSPGVAARDEHLGLVDVGAQAHRR